MFKRTQAVNKILKMTKRKRVIQGGTWAGKTFAIIAILINTAAKESNQQILVVAESIPALKKGVIKDFLNIMSMTGRLVESRWNITERIYTFANGSTIQFDSFDSVGKAKAAGKRTHLFINEANHILFAIADTLMTRTSKTIWIDYNPDDEFWVQNELEDYEELILTYNDNDQTPETIKEDLTAKLHKAYHDPFGDHNDPNNIKSKYWANWVTVYIKGQIGTLEGVIFKNWEQVESIPANARLKGYGLDFGFSNDPTAIVAVYYADQKYYLDEVCYETGMLNKDIAERIKERIGRAAEGVADSAEPKTIKELKTRGCNVRPAKKGQGSILWGIELLQEHHFCVTSRSTNLIHEFRSYRWAEDKTGEKTNTPVDKNNHLMDALRYWGTRNLTGRKRSAFA